MPAWVKHLEHVQIVILDHGNYSTPQKYFFKGQAILVHKTLGKTSYELALTAFFLHFFIQNNYSMIN